jgi:hypothetical protein
MKADYEQIDQLVTGEQIVNITGTELDELIAEKVMCWKVRYDTHKNGRTSDYSWSGAIDHLGNYRIIKPSKYLSWEENGWSPSTDITAAWEVIEKIKSDGLLIVMLDTPKEFYYFRVLKNGIGWRGYKAKTAPEAICKAILLAVLEVGSNAS